MTKHVSFFVLTCLLLYFSGSLSAQVLYYETVGTGSSETIVDYTGWDTTDPAISYAETEPTYNTKISSSGADYDGASGGSAIWIGGGGGSFTIMGLNTTGYTELEMTFGMKPNFPDLDNIVFEYSDDGGEWTSLTMTNVNAYSWNVVTITNVPVSENLSLRWTCNTDLGWKDIRLDDLRIFDPNGPQPTINITGELSDFGPMITGAKSTPQSYTIEGNTLSEDIVITPPDGFDISLTETSGFSSNPITLSHADGVVSSTTIYVRFAPTEEKAYSGSITNLSAGSNSPSLTVSGTGEAPSPYITITGTIDDFGNQPVTTTSDEQTYTVEAIYLEGDLTITPPAGFEISQTSGSGFSSSAIVLTPTDGTISPTAIYVHFAPTVIQSYAANLTHSSSNANNPDIALSGEGLSTDPTIIVGTVSNFGSQTVNTISAEKNYSVEAYNLTENLNITPPEGFEISITSGAAFSAENPLTLSPSNGTIENTHIYLRFAPTEAKNYTGTIDHSADGVTENVQLNGTGTVRQMHRARIVDFGADHGEGYYRDKSTNKHPEIKIDVDGDGDPNNDGVAFWEYSFTDPMNPSAIHYDREATSSMFYGGMTAFFNKPGYGITEGLINENHELRDDHNFMIVNTDNSLERKAWGVWFWKKEDFLNGGAPTENNVLLDENSLLAVHISRYWNGMQGGRFVVRDGDQFYISEYVFTDALRATQMLVPTESRWAEYNPAEPYHVSFDADAATFADHSFTDVTAVGFYIFDDILDSENIQVKWHSVEVWATIERDPTVGYHAKQFDADMVEVAASGDVETFYINKSEIPYTFWQKVYKWAISNQYCFDIPNSRGYVFDRDGDMGSMDYNAQTHTAYEPATDMTWYDAVLWCNALSELEGYTPCYYADAAKTEVLKQIKGRDNPADYDNTYHIYVNWDANGYRLPTLSEWAHAAAEGNNNAWTNGKSQTAEVMASDANSNGLYDMQGNVWEFVWDVDNAGDHFDPNTHKTHTVVGGGFINSQAPQHAQLPYGETPFTGNYNIGFRAIRAENGATPPTTQNAGSFETWSFDKDSKLEPETPQTPNSSLIADDLVYLSGDKTFGKQGTDNYEDDNVGFIRSDEAKITLTPYYASKYEITYAKWNEVYQWAVNNGYIFDRDGDMGSMDWRVGQFSHGQNEPVTDIGWNDAALWCNALSEYEGLTPVYYLDTLGDNDIVLRTANQWRLRMEYRPTYNSATTTQNMTIVADFSKDGYRLPTETEWDYLFRNGNESQYFNVPDFVNQGWLIGNSDNYTHPVGTATNDQTTTGVYDLAGNVEEWIWDWLGRSYYVAHNPKGNSDPDNLFGKIVKGRSFGSHALSSNDRSFRQERESAARPYLGFRVVRCDAGEHPAIDEFVANVVLDFNPEDYDKLTGKTFRNNLHRTGAYQKTGVPEGPVSVKWEFETGGAVKSSPVLVDGVVYIGSDDNHVYALDAATGSELWSYTTSGDVSASATVHDGILYIGDEAGYLHAIYTKGENAGTRKWRIQQTSQGQIVNTASVVYNTVFASWTGWTNESRATGFDINSKKELWRYRTDRVNSGAAAMAIDTFTFYQPASDNTYIAGDLATEIRVWKGVGIHGYNCTPIADENTILYADEFEILAVDRANGSKKWRFVNGKNTDKNQWSSPAVGTVNISDTDTPIAVFAQLSGDIWGLDMADGSDIWQYTATGAFESSPSIANNVVYVGNNDGYLYAIDAETGAELWKFDAGDVIYSTPLPDDGTVYVGCNNGKVYALHNAAINSKPTVDLVADVTINVSDTEAQTVVLTGIGDGDSGTQSLSITAQSSKPLIVTDVTVVNNGDGTATLSYTPQGILGETLITITVEDDGDVNNLAQVSFKVTVDNTTAIEGLYDGHISYYPNPVRNKLSIELQADVMRELMVVDMNGRKVYAEKLSGEQTRYLLDVSSYKAGFYLLKLKGKRSTYNLRFIVH